jgi:hypothetical protein
MKNDHAVIYFWLVFFTLKSNYQILVNRANVSIAEPANGRPKIQVISIIIDFRWRFMSYDFI